ncbi:MAG: aminotransferase class III-fold pyridoxal phosphate-dependent enzyme, partial [Clostridiales bacterium]|nr:aminotransferase class III-fold pyridoxal phosphate-dependent enzyme [Clostridiales bacterium]
MAGIKEIVKEFYTVDDALAFDEQTTKDMQHKYLNEKRTILGDCKFFVKAEGARLTDGSGNTHYDFIGAVGVCSVGNNNPFVWEQLEKVYKTKQQMIGVVAYHSLASAFAHNMAILSPGGQLTKMGTATGGAESIEAAIKLVKLASRG